MYDYQKERAFIFTEDGIKMLLKIRDRAKQLHKSAGVFRLDRVIEGCSGDSFQMLACVDYLAEKQEIKLLWDKGATQHRVYSMELSADD